MISKAVALGCKIRCPSGGRRSLIPMVFFNYATMQMAAKIVYYGPGLCGKTTNLHVIYGRTAPTSRGEMVCLETETDRTLFFDLLPLDVGVIGGFKTRLQLYTVPGQVFYNTTRKLVLKGVDGIVFVADSQRPMKDPNVESLRNLRENLAEIGISLDATPHVFQYNKRDLEAPPTRPQGPDGGRAETSRGRRDRDHSRSPADDVVEGRRLGHRRGHRCDGDDAGGDHGSCRARRRPRFDDLPAQAFPGGRPATEP